MREKLRDRFDITLPRFDMMAQLDREPQGLKMSELSRRLMVTGGNVTGLTDQLVAEGLVVTAQRSRATAGRYNVRLTPKGKRQFDAMAVEHERWIDRAARGDVPASETRGAHESLGHLKSALTGHAMAPASRDDGVRAA